MAFVLGLENTAVNLMMVSARDNIPFLLNAICELVYLMVINTLNYVCDINPVLARGREISLPFANFFNNLKARECIELNNTDSCSLYIWRPPTNFQQNLSAIFLKKWHFSDVI